MAERQGLLMDWGGVLTTDVFASFAAFCAAEGLDADAVKSAFATDPRARELLVEFECGRLQSAEFEEAFAPVLGISSSDGLIGRLFGGMSGNVPLLEAVEGFRRPGSRRASCRTHGAHRPTRPTCWRASSTSSSSPASWASASPTPRSTRSPWSGCSWPRSSSSSSTTCPATSSPRGRWGSTRSCTGHRADAGRTHAVLTD